MKKRLVEFLASEWARRTIIACYVVGLAGTIGAYIGISTMDVRTSAYFYGPSTLEQGATTALRGVVLNAPTGRFRRDVDVTFRLRDRDSNGSTKRATPEEHPNSGKGGGGVTLAEVLPGRNGLIHPHLEVPDTVEPGRYTLVMSVTGPSIDPFETRTDVRVVRTSGGQEYWPTKTSRIPDMERRRSLADGPVIESSGPVAIDVLPPDGEVIRGMQDEIFVRTYNRETGRPVPARVTFEKVEGLGQWKTQSGDPEPIRTDALGLGKLGFRPVGGQKWTLVAEPLRPVENTADEDGGGEGTEPADSRTTLRIHTVASQLELRPKTSLTADSTIYVEVRSVFQSHNLLVDVYDTGGWIQATDTDLQNHSAELAIDVHDDESNSTLNRIQVSKGLYGAGEAWDIAHVVRIDDTSESTFRRALRRTATTIAKHEQDPYFQHLSQHDTLSEVDADREQIDGWLGAFLTAYPRHFERPDTLINSQKADRARMETWKDGVQSDLMVLVVLALLSGLAVIVYVVITGVMRAREHDRKLREIDVELAAESTDDDLELDFEQFGRGEQVQFILLAAIGLGTFIMFGFGIVLLLGYL